MSSVAFDESTAEEAALEWLSDLGYAVLHGAKIAPGGERPERASYQDVILDERLRRALARLNPGLPQSALDDAFRRVTQIAGSSLIERNRAFHKLLVDGVTVEYSRSDGSIAGDRARLVDFERVESNDWLAVNQFTVKEGQHTRRADIVIFLNGLPIAVIELKNPADASTTIWSAYQQLVTYQSQIPSLFTTNEALVISDGVKARVGALGAGREWFKPWRTISGLDDAPSSMSELRVVLEGPFERRRFLDFLHYFIVFEDRGGAKIMKKMAGYHQFHAVNVAVEETLRASLAGQEPVSELRETPGVYHVGHQPGGKPGDHRVGVIWHTQGSGKSLTMAFYAGRLILEPAMANPTIVVLTDRIDLDGQLFATFARCSDLLRQLPVQAEDRADLRKKLDTSSGGVIFTTIQKFAPAEKKRTGDPPVLSDRHNIVVIADEAHRSQYDFLDGLAKHLHGALPNASFIGFTGTPIEQAEANTRTVFGDYISIYDIQRSVADGATVPIYYESRLAKLALREEARPRIDPDFEEITEGEEIELKEKLKSKWAQLEAVVGSENRIELIARDLVEHFEQRQAAIEGKAMIVVMSRRIAVELYDAIVALRPDWASDDDTTGVVKVVMTGSAADDQTWQRHIRTKQRRELLADRFRDPNDPFKIVIVRDMWLTGFDAPSLHTMYLDKPVRGHGLMQAIARVNRVFKDKPGGLVVDYLGLADELRQAMATYTEAGGSGDTTLDQAAAIAVMREKYEICCGILHGFAWSAWTGDNASDQVSLVAAALEHILSQPDGKDRFLTAVNDLSRAFALAVPSDEALAIRDDLIFFQAVKANLSKNDSRENKADGEFDHAIRQIISGAVASDEVIDIFATAGLKKPDISILSDEFLAEVSGLKRPNLAVELLQRLISGEIRSRSKRNVVQARSFAEMLERTVRGYQNRGIETAQVIEELIALARDIREAEARGEALGLTDDEVAFFDALETNDSAVKVLGDDKLKLIAHELVETVRKNASIDWTIRENVRAQLRVAVRRVLRKYGYTPDKQAQATKTIIEQAELLTASWVTG